MSERTAVGVRVKVCGVRTPGDAAVVAAAGADYMGVILSPGYFRSVEPGLARAVYEGGGRGGWGASWTRRPRG